MSCVSGVVSDVFIVRWVEPEANDVAKLVEDVRKEAAKRREKLHYVAVIGSDVPVPDDATRKALSASVDEVLESCQTVHMVIEGKGLRRALVRSLSTSIILLSRHRGRTFAHDEVERAFYTIAGADRSRADALMREAIDTGLLTERLAAPAGT